jgi:hypothetical protein
MTRKAPRLSRAAKAELAQCAADGLTAPQTRRRLTLRGVQMADRTVARYLANARDEQRRICDLEAIGRGLGSVHVGAAGATEILRQNLPEWRRKQANILRELLDQFLQNPSAKVFCSLSVGLHALLLGATLPGLLESRDA